MNIDIDFVGQYGMLFVCYVVTVESKFWVAKTDTKQIPNLKGFKGCENGYSMFTLKWLSFYFYRVTKPLKHLNSTIRCICSITVKF